MTCDDERAARIEHDIIGRERRRHPRTERQRLRDDVPRVEENLAERRGRDRYERAVGGDRDAVCEGDARRDDFRVHHRRRRRRRRRGVRERDVCDPGERERKYRLGDGERLAEHAGEAPGEAVVVREVERGRARERERVGRDELRAGDRADPRGAGGRVPRERELLDRAVVPRVVHDEESGGRPVGLGRVDVEPEGVEVVRGGVALQCDPLRPRAGVAGVVEPERSAGRRVAKWAHDCVPGFAVGVAAEQDGLVEYRAATVDFLPKDGIFAVTHVIRRRVPDYLAMVAVRPLCIIARRKIRGWDEDVSRSPAVPPYYESLG